MLATIKVREGKARARFGCILAGLAVTLLQLGFAVTVTHQEGSLRYRYSTLVQHDSYWFANIIERGYDSTVPPSNHKMMEVSNVAFFPAYPLVGKVLARCFHLEVETALLLAAQIAAWGFWTYLFLFFHEWKLSLTLRFFGILAILAHPAAFFLIAGYSESLFLMMLVGFIYWSNCKGRGATMLAFLHGYTMSATRIVGVVCAGYPIVRSLVVNGFNNLTRPRVLFKEYATPILISSLSILGTVSFFFYCQVRWGCWNLYMLSQEAGWAVAADYRAVFRPSSYHWLIPDLDDGRDMSQLVMTLAAVVFVVVAICEIGTALRRRTDWSKRLGIYFCAVAIYYISVSGVASVEMESMLRYDFCTHALLVLALLHYLHEFREIPVFVKATGMATTSLAAALGFALQFWYIWNFTQGNWVA